MAVVAVAVAAVAVAAVVVVNHESPTTQQSPRLNILTEYPPCKHFIRINYEFLTKLP